MERNSQQEYQESASAAVPSPHPVIVRARSILSRDGQASPESLKEIIALLDEAPEEDDTALLKYLRLQLHRSYQEKSAEKHDQFLGSIVMAIRGLPKFIGKFVSDFPFHSHLSVPCVVCELKALTEGQETRTDTLRNALCSSYPSHTFFEPGRTNDVSKVLKALFFSIHLSADCSQSFCGRKCTAHELFGSRFVEIITTDFCLETKDCEYTRFFHRISANELLETKVSLHEMLKKDLYALRDPRDGSSLRFLPDLSGRAEYLILILEWAKPCTEADLSYILEAIPLEMRPEPNFHDSKQYYSLVSMIAHNTWESISFSYSDSVPGWFRNGLPGVNIGSWFDVCGVLKQLKCEPRMLFFEAIA